MKSDFSELNDKLERLEGAFLENLDKVTPLEFTDITNYVKEVKLHQIEYSSCGCYHSCGSDYSRNGKCSCYSSCGSNYSR